MPDHPADPFAAPSAPAVPLGTGPDGTTVVNGESLEPVLVYGVPRSGKSRGLCVPAIRDWPGPVVATSVRTDLVDLTGQARRRLGPVFVVDPSGGTAHADAAGWDPVSACGSWAAAVATADAMARGSGVTGTNDGYWNDQAGSLLAVLFRAANATGRGIGQVVTWLALGREADGRDGPPRRAAGRAAGRGTDADRVAWQHRHDAVLGRLDTGGLTDEQRRRAHARWLAANPAPPVPPPGPLRHREGVEAALRGEPEAWAQAQGIWHGDGRTLAITLSVARTVLAACRSPAAVEAAEAGAFDPDVLLEAWGTAYLTAPPHDQKQYASIFVAVVERVLAAAYRRDALARFADPLLVVLDEAANIAPLRDLDVLATTAAGSGIQLVTVWHSHSQLVHRYGRAAADAIAAAHPVVVALPGQRDALTLASLDAATGGEPVVGFDGPRGSPWRSVPERHAVVVRGTDPPVLTDLRNDHLHGPDPAVQPPITGIGQYL